MTACSALRCDSQQHQQAPAKANATQRKRPCAAAFDQHSPPSATQCSLQRTASARKRTSTLHLNATQRQRQQQRNAATMPQQRNTAPPSPASTQHVVSLFVRGGFSCVSSLFPSNAARGIAIERVKSGHPGTNVYRLSFPDSIVVGFSTIERLRGNRD